MDNQFEEYCVVKVDRFLSDKKYTPKVKRKFQETSELYGTVYKFPHFGVEIMHNQVTIFGKYKKQFFDAELFDNTDELLADFFLTFEEFYHNPNIAKHPIIRFFNKFKLTK